MTTPKELFTLLSDETRLRCILLLSKKREICVCEFCYVLSSIQPKISRHLAYLRNSGLVLTERKDQWVYYRLNPGLSKWAKQIIINVVDVLSTEEPYRSDLKKINDIRKKHTCSNV